MKKEIYKRFLASSLVAGMVVTGLPMGGNGEVVKAEDTDDSVYVTFSESGITAEGGDDSSYKIKDSQITIQAGGTYVFSGVSSNGNIKVKKNIEDQVNIVLNGLDLTEPDSGSTVIDCNDSSVVSIEVAEGTTNTLTQSNTDGEKPKSAINASADLTICGTGVLNVIGQNKNGIKTDDSLTIDGNVILNVTSADDGIAADDVLTINGGTITVSAAGDGIKSNPDTDDDGNLAGTGDVVINGGTFDIDTTGDGIFAVTNLTINGGTFDVKTNGGYTTTLASDADSCKGIKSTGEIDITGGSFDINSADDAIHSNGYIYITGGSFDIYSGDDGAHADTLLSIGQSNASNSLIDLNVLSSYEGLEAGTVQIYSGDIDVAASDDGINAAGGTDGSGDNSGNDNFNPWNQGGGNSGGNFPGGGFRTASVTTASTDDTTTGTYSIDFYGGDTYVDAAGDGIDSNGSISMSAGKLVVFGAAANSDNNCIDCESTCTVTGGIVFGAGAYNNMYRGITTGSGQGLVTTTNVTYSSGKYINVYSSKQTCNATTAVFSIKTSKNVNHVIYCAPSVSSSTYTIKGENSGYTIVSDSDSDDDSNSDSDSDSDSDDKGGSSDSGNTDSGNTDSGNTDSGNTDSGNTDKGGNTEDKGGNAQESSGSASENTSSWISLGDCQVTVADCTYTGQALTPELTLTYNGQTVSSEEYVVSYENNIDAGTGKYVVTAKSGGNAQDSISGTFTIAKAPNTVAASSTEFSYKASNKKRSISLGATATYGTITYSSSNSKIIVDEAGNVTIPKNFVGKSTITLTVDGGSNYNSAVSTVSLKVVPASVKLKTVKSKTAKKLSLTWSKNSKATGYQIQICKKNNFTNATTINVTSKSKTSKTISSLTKNKKYYVRIRAYKTVNKVKYYSDWSAVKSVKVK